MLDKPKIQITNFAAMGDDGLFYCEGFRTKKIQGQSVLTTGWDLNNYIIPSTATTGTTTRFSDLGRLNGLTNLHYSSSLKDRVVGISTNKLYDFHVYTAANHYGLLHTIHASLTASNNPDVQTTTNNNILYSLANYVGIAYVGIATGGSNTTLIDTTRNFTTAGIGTGNGVNKVLNLTRTIEYTVTSVSTTTNANDTINFDTSTAAQAGDIYIAFVDTKFNLDANAPTGVHFANQITKANFVRQIKLLGSKYYVLNGNYLASIAVDESTFVDKAKQLPYNVQAVCFDINQDKFLIGGDYFDGGKLILGDSTSDGWLSVLDVSKPPSMIRAYSNGWIVVIGNIMYFTDGYQLKEIFQFTFIDGYLGSNTPIHYNGCEILNEKIVFSGNFSHLGRGKNGVYVLDLQSGLTLVAPKTDGSRFTKFYRGSIGAMTKVNSSIGQRIFVSANSSGGTVDACINWLTTASLLCSGIAYIKLPRKMKLSKVELNLSPKLDSSDATENGNINVTVCYGDGRLPLYSYGQVGASSTTTSLKNSLGATQSASVGQEIMIIAGDGGGMRSWVTEIANDGEATETLTLSPALNSTPTENAIFNIINLYKTETRAISNLYIPDVIEFDITNFYSDKLYLEIYMESANRLLDINSISIY